MRPHHIDHFVSSGLYNKDRHQTNAQEFDLNRIGSFLTAIAGMSAMAQTPSLPISYTTPKSWQLLETKPQNGATVFLYQIKDGPTDKANPIPSNALLTLYKLPAGVSSADADAVVASHMKNATFIESGVDGESWKTYLYVAYQDKQQLVILYRIGISNGYGVEAMICFPHVATPDNKAFSLLTIEESTVPGDKLAGIYCNPMSMALMVDQFNQFCSGLKISGNNFFAAKFKFSDPPPDTKYYRKNDDEKK